jgi:hypothetical protein
MANGAYTEAEAVAREGGERQVFLLPLGFGTARLVPKDRGETATSFST